MEQGFAAWTRLKNDQLRENCDEAQSTAPLRYVTFAPEYLQQSSCSRGSNANNCRVFDGGEAVLNEMRIGKVTNRRELMRESTNVHALGVPTAPHQGNGPLLGDAQLAMLSSMRGEQQVFSKSCDVIPVGAPVLHHLDMSTRIDPEPPSLFADRLVPRDEIYQSSRVQRRNDWVQKCTRIDQVAEKVSSELQ